MKQVLTLGLVLSTLALGGCGVGGGLGGYGGSGGSLTFGCLEVEHEADSASPLLVTFLLQDVDSHALLREQLVNLAPGQQVDLMDIPSGPYEVVAVFDDGRRSPRFDEPPIRVFISPDIDPKVTFRLP